MGETTITLRELEYQRNGISGEGFFTAKFDLFDEEFLAPERLTIVEGIEKPEDDRSWHLIAVIPSEVIEKGMKGDAEEHGFNRVYVIDPEDLGNGWRGDRIGYVLVPLVQEHKYAAFASSYPEAAAKLPVSATGRM